MAANPDFTRFLDRRDAGRRLAARLVGEPLADPVVIGMARGGVPVAAEIARALGAPLDVAIVRKVGAPDQPELAIGAIAEGDAVAIDPRDAGLLGIDEETVAAIVARERRELERRERVYRAECPQLPLAGRTAILVDDGLATGHTARAAARALHKRGAATIVLAVPVCPIESTLLPPEPPVDRFVYVTAPRQMMAVGYWYADFPQVSDDEVISLLRAARGEQPAQSAPREPAVPTGAGESEIEIDAGGGVRLD
ncbi:MAG: phosphoribosyltransferase, partial [Thermoleophilia bacterium]|nr:phosphoribosyltransferase [Thermoleophilia bacterium]